MFREHKLTWPRNSEAATHLCDASLRLLPLSKLIHAIENAGSDKKITFLCKIPIVFFEGASHSRNQEINAKQ